MTSRLNFYAVILIFFLISVILFQKINHNKETCDESVFVGNYQEISARLSEILTQKARKLGQTLCETNANRAVSETGGYCTKSVSSYKFDKNFAEALSSYLVGKRVANFGEGSGKYREHIITLNKVKSYDGFDGAPFVEENTDGKLKFLDLSLPIYHLQPYDWIISVEVAEHIPKEFESIYVDNIVRHAKEGIIISWAIPGQIGLEHVNLRSFEYVKSLFESKGYRHLENDSKKLKESSKFGWIRQNLNIFIRV